MAPAGPSARLVARRPRLAEIATAREMVAKLETTLPIARQREADFRQLADQGFMPSHAKKLTTLSAPAAGAVQPFLSRAMAPRKKGRRCMTFT